MTTTPLQPQDRKRLSGYGLSPESLSGACRLHFDKGEPLCRSGHAMSHLFVLLSGQAKISMSDRCGRTLLFCLLDGEGMLGDVELVQVGQEATTTVEAMTPLVCIGIPLVANRERLRGSLAFMNRVAEELAAKLARLSRDSSLTILSVLEPRLCSYIVVAARDGFFHDKWTDLAERLGTSYRHLHRSLGGLCARGVLAREGRGYRILDSKRLEALGAGEDGYRAP